MPKYNNAEKIGKFSEYLTAFSEEKKLLTLINKENHSNFGAKMFANANYTIFLVLKRSSCKFFC